MQSFLVAIVLRNMYIATVPNPIVMLKHPTPTIGARFGSSVALSDGVNVVGCIAKDEVVVYSFTGGSISYVKLKCSCIHTPLYMIRCVAEQYKTLNSRSFFFPPFFPILKIPTAI